MVLKLAVQAIRMFEQLEQVWYRSLNFSVVRDNYWSTVWKSSLLPCALLKLLTCHLMDMRL